MAEHTHSHTKSELPPSFQCREGNLLQAFQAAGSPFRMDVAPVKDVTNIYDDPAIKAALKAIPNAVIITDDALAAMIPPELRQPFADDVMTMTRGALNEDEILSRLKETEAQIYKGIAAFDPRLADVIKNDIQSEQKDGTELERISLLDDTLKRVLSDTEYTAALFPDGRGGVSMSLMKLPSAQNISGYFEGKIEAVTGLDVKPAPGTNEQQAALIVVHEIEHAMGQMNTIGPYVNSVNQNIHDQGCTKIGLSSNVSHMQEMESALSEVSALRDSVPQDLLEYHAAMYVALYHDKHMQHAQDDRHVFDIHPDLDTGEQYMTLGFQMHDYIETGALPDYAQTTLDVRSFFSKTQGAFDQATGGASGVEPTIPFTMSVVREGLENEIYTPEEARVAQTFLKTMGEDLGIAAQALPDPSADATSEHGIGAPVSGASPIKPR